MSAVMFVGAWDPNQPRDEDGKWTSVESFAARFDAEKTTLNAGPLATRAYRVGPLVDRGRGIFYGGDAESIAAYARIHEGHTTQEYPLAAKNVAVSPNVFVLHKELFKGKSFQDAVWEEDKKSGFKSSTDAAFRVEAKIAKKLVSLGHDAVIYTRPPLPAKSEIAMLPIKSRQLMAEYGDEEDLRDAARSFACVLAPIPEPYAARVQALAARIPDAALAEKGREAAPHCTVRWGLGDADRAAVRAAIAAWPGPARLRLGATSSWPTPDGDCVKIDVESPDLADLRRLIEGAAPAAADTHPFEAHITLAYVASGRGGDFAGWADLEGLDIAVDVLVFSAQDDSTTPLPLGSRAPVALIGAWDPNQPRDEAGKWTDGVSDAEWQSWADFGHSAINDVLTGKDIVGTIDDNGGEKITKKSAAEYAQTARRIDAAAASQVAVNPGESNEFFRGEIHENLAALKKAYPHNKEITIDRLVSTSGDYQHAQGYADQGHEMSPDALKVVVRFYNKNGVRGARARYFGEPSPEVVLARGQKFRVRGIRKHPQTGVHEVVLQSKESHPADLPRVTITTKASRIRAAAFDPNQPRDEAGKWTGGSTSPKFPDYASDALGQFVADASAAMPKLNLVERDVRHTLHPRDEVYRGDTVGGLRVRTSIPNTDSISATLYDGEYEELPGLRSVPIAALGLAPYRAKDDQARVADLAERIRESGEIAPLIVVHNKKEGSYVLEGNHRARALQHLGITAAPALVLVEYPSEEELRGLAFDPNQPRDEQGRWTDGPLVNASVFHGGVASHSAQVTYFTRNKGMAESYVDMSNDRFGDGGALHEATISLDKPADEEAVRKAAEGLPIDNDLYTPASIFDAELHGEGPVSALIRRLRYAGYDGAILTDIAYGRQIEDQAIIRFNPAKRNLAAPAPAAKETPCSGPGYAIIGPQAAENSPAADSIELIGAADPLPSRYRMSKFAGQHAAELVAAPRKVRIAIRNEVRKALRNGEGPEGIANRLIGEVDMPPERLDTIARTEFAFARTAARLEEAASDFGDVDLEKTWRADPDCCPMCAAMDGQTVPVDEPFQDAKGGLHAGSPAHPNCRCDIEIREVAEMQRRAAIGFVGAGFDPNQPRDENGRWTSVAEASASYLDRGGNRQYAIDDALRGFKEIGSVFRGITEEEAESIRQTQEIKSTLKYSHASEGTSFAEDFGIAESAVNFGSTNPHKTQRANYVIQVESGPDIVVDPRDYWPKAKAGVPASRIRRVWQFLPDGAVRQSRNLAAFRSAYDPDQGK